MSKMSNLGARRLAACGALAVMMISAAGCATWPHGAYRVFRVDTGAESELDALIAAADESDIVLFGEAHYDPICNAAQAALYDALLARRAQAGRPPTTLAMEFFETDTQPALDAYLRGDLPEMEFVTQTRQGPRYADSHRALIESAKRHHADVIAANAPRTIVRAFRESGEEYAAFRAAQPPGDQALIPETLTVIDGAYRDRFMDFMRGAVEAHGGGSDTDEMILLDGDAPPPDPMSPERMYMAQSLWDESMASRIAAARAAQPDRNVLLIVGGFHVERDGGTTRKLRIFRPHDRILVVRYRTDEEGADFMPADEKSGEFLIIGQAGPQ